MTYLAILFIAIVAVFASTIGVQVMDAWLVKRNILPDPKLTTIADVARLRDNGQRLWALRRLRQLPEYKHLSLREAVAALDKI